MFLVAGCREPDFITSHGVEVFVEHGVCMSSRSMEKAVDHFIEKSEEHDLVTEKEFVHAVYHTGLIVTFYPEMIYFDGHDRMGLQNGMIVDVYFPGCFSDSAMYHEFGHYIREAVWGEWFPDMEHQDIPFWNIMDREIPDSFVDSFYNCIDPERCK